MADKHLFTFLLLSSYSIQAPECTFTRSANQERPCFHSKSWPGLLESCFQGQRHGGHPRRANNIVPFCLCKDREYSTILAMDDADFANLINFVPSQIQTAKRHQLLLVRQRILVRDGKTPCTFGGGGLERARICKFCLQPLLRKPIITKQPPKNAT